MGEDKDRLIATAARFRRLANAIGDAEVVHRLEQLAKEYEEKAKEGEPRKEDPGGPSREPGKT